MAAIANVLEPVAPAPPAANTAKAADKNNGKNSGGCEHPAFSKVLKEHAAGPKTKVASVPEALAVAETTSDSTVAPVSSTSTAGLSATATATAPLLESVTRPEAPQQSTPKPLKLQTLVQAEPTQATETQAPLTDAPVLTTPLPEAAAVLPTAAETPLQLVAPEAFLRWLDTLKTFTDSAAPQSATTLSSTAASADRLPVPVAALLATVAPVIDALTSHTTPAATPPADHTPFGLTVAALNTLPATASPVAEAARLSTPLAMDSADWPQQLGEQIRWRLGEGIQEARIEINPRELGAVDVRLSMDEQGLRVHLSAEHAKTRELLQSELPRLRESLHQGGIVLADAQVGREAPSREGARQHGAHGAFKPEHAPGHGRDDDDARATHVGGWRTRIGLLDDYA